MKTTSTLLDGLCFAEGPRWRDGKLWFSDMHAHRVCTLDAHGDMEIVVDVPMQPSGLGWLPDGRLLIVSMLDRKLLTYDDGVLAEFADLGELARFHCNDMVVDHSGRAYVGNFGFDLHNNQKPVATELIMVSPDGHAQVVADDLFFPNGTVITPDNKTLIIGETFAARLTAFDIAEDGTLSKRRTWAQLEGAVPDGICLDEAGGIWVASPTSNEVLRVLEGGEVTDRVKVETQAYACMLGGRDNRQLFILTAASSDPLQCQQQIDGKIESLEVKFAGIGLP